MLGFNGADKIEIDAQGDLVLHTAGGAIRQEKPLVYQEPDAPHTLVITVTGATTNLNLLPGGGYIAVDAFDVTR